MRRLWFKIISCSILLSAHISAGAEVSFANKIGPAEGDNYRFLRTNPEQFSKIQDTIRDQIIPMVKEGRDAYRFLSNACPSGTKAIGCSLTKSKLEKIEDRLQSHELVRGGLITKTSIKDCIYAAMVACSLLGGPNPDQQGFTAMSSLAGKELERPIEHFRKELTETGSAGAK